MLVGLLCSCLSNPGEAPPTGLLLSPIATAMRQPSSGAPTHLLVLNSNFNLRYAGGSLHSYDLDVLNATIDAACVAPRAGLSDAECRETEGCAVPEACVVVPEQLERVDDAGGQLIVTTAPGLLVGEVRVGSYGSSVALDAAGERVYLGIRADADITVVDLEADGGLRCGGNAGEVHECDAAHRHVDQTLAAALTDQIDQQVGDLTHPIVAAVGIGPGAGDGHHLVHLA